MEIKQIYELLNEINKEVLGVKQDENGQEVSLIKEDLSNIVDLGTEVFNANAMDKYCNALVDKVGRMVFVNRPYTGGAPNIRKEGWEFGAVLQKVRSKLPESVENESWELTNGQVYEQDTFTQPEVSVKFFSKKTTFEVDISITDEQMKSAFTSAEEMNKFIAMIYQKVEDKFVLDNDNLTMRTINNMIGETFYNLNSSGTYTGTGVRCINLYKMYKTLYPNTTLTNRTCLKDKDFLRYASQEISLVKSRLKRMSTLFNIGGYENHTPESLLHVVMLDVFVKSCDSYLSSDTFHKELVALPKYEEVSYWQGTGDTYDFEDISKIKIRTASGHDVTASGIVGVMFDDEACITCNRNRRVTSHRNAKAEFINYFYKEDVNWFNDENENFIVFYVA